MGYILIIIGVVCIVTGIITLQKDSPTVNAPVKEVIKEKTEIIKEKTIITTQADDRKLQNQQKGLAFEKYVISKFPKDSYSIKEWRSDKFTDGRYAESSTYPDMELTLHLGKYEHEFAIECKWRSKFTDEKSLEWSYDEQIKRYNKYSEDKSIPVFIILGIGGTPSAPENVFCIPLQALQNAHVEKEYLEKFRHQNPKNFYYFAKENKLL